MIKRFDSIQAMIAILSFTDQRIASMLQLKLCETKFRQLLQILKVKVTSNILKELILDIERFEGSMDMLRTDHKITKNAKDLLKIIKGKS